MGIARYRRFWFENETGDLVPLNGERGIWLTDPQGLGLESDEKYAGAGGFFERTSPQQDKQPTPRGVLRMKKTPGYALYTWLADWLFAAEALWLVYRPPFQAEAYRLQIEVAKIEKSEADETGWLLCPITLRALTPWSTSEVVRQTVERSGLVPFRTGVSRVSVDRLTDGLSYSASVTVQPHGHRAGALTIVQEPGGVLADPAISFTGADSGIEYGRCQISGTISSEAALEYSNVPRAQFVRARVYASDGSVLQETDLLDLVDLAWEPFPELPADEPVIVTLRTGSERTGVMAVTVRSYRRTV